MLDLLSRIVFAAKGARSEVTELLEADPGGWEIDEHYARHGGAGIVLWINSGARYLKAYDPLRTWEWRPSWAERRMIWRSFESLQNAAAQKRRRKVMAGIRKAIEAAEARDAGEAKGD